MDERFIETLHSMKRNYLTSSAVVYYVKTNRAAYHYELRQKEMDYRIEICSWDEGLDGFELQFLETIESKKKAIDRFIGYMEEWEKDNRVRLLLKC
jgi:hypothetical protein